MIPEYTHSPNWTIASFDLETVPLSGENRVPTGADSKDTIVMISVVKWNNNGVEYYLLYFTPCNAEFSSARQNSLVYDGDTIHYNSIKVENEKELLIKFHNLIEDAHVLTGYNINNFDIPCIFSRLLWLRMHDYLEHYSSKTIGDYMVTTFKNKIVLDMYHYFRIFSSYNLPGFKLDDVAKVKLNKFKIPLKSTGIHAWYVSKEITSSLLQSNNVKECFETLKKYLYHVTEEQFGTFTKYLEYCLIDSELVRLLFIKETALHFLIERANFTAMDAIHAFYYGNSRYLLELFKTYGTILGYFININYFKNMTDPAKYKSMFINGTYQGALNYCIPKRYYKNISVMDFTSMYPCSLLSANLCYGTCTILTTEEYVNSPLAQTLTAIPFRNHSKQDFDKENIFKQGELCTENYHYPTFDPNKDKFVIVVNQQTKAFLPELVLHLLNLRKYHQREYKSTKNIYHYNSQLNIKILINSLYGVMGSKDSCLAKLVIAIAIVTLARYQLLGSYHFMVRKGYDVCYADTDSLMVHNWPVDNCDEVNKYLNLPHVEIKYEERFKSLLILSKKRYVFETQNGKFITKGFQKKLNDLIKFMSDTILIHAMNSLQQGDANPSQGWIVWVDTLLQAYYMCRNPKTYSITRKTKNLDEYKSTTCSTVRMLQKYPEKAGEYIEYTFSRADVAAKEVLKWIMDVDDVKYLNFEQFGVKRPIEIGVLNRRTRKRIVEVVSTDKYLRKEGDVMYSMCQMAEEMHGFLMDINVHEKKMKNTVPLDNPDNSLETTIDESIVCGECGDPILFEEEEYFTLSCGCTLHVFCLMYQFDVLMDCATCGTSITPADRIVLETMWSN
ncbi:DNA polymerase delta catalytic subunit like protein [Argiope bruennichi]|uniref:DNA polymerase n=1 Tax=Argiope bruennichi TaxID=94029 RepID=A0A8T0G164_ARGBR|nr:DNA polymerase delta catalytic subunit like protein [Argiope bruennichi]